MTGSHLPNTGGTIKVRSWTGPRGLHRLGQQALLTGVPLAGNSRSFPKVGPLAGSGKRLSAACPRSPPA